MKGVICKRHVLSHPLTVIRSFGWPVFFRALAAGPDRTFLSIIANTVQRKATPSEDICSFIERCVTLEKRARDLYLALSEQQEKSSPLADFLLTLAAQEQGHAELLEYCRDLACRSTWREEEVTCWRGVVPVLERRMGEVEGLMKGLTHTTRILEMVIALEGSEINNVFRGVVAATDNEFVKTFESFQSAEAEHIDYICREIPMLDSSLSEACDRLRERHG